MDKLILQLENGVGVAINGKLIEVEVIEINNPSVLTMNLWADVKEVCFDAISTYQEKNETAETATTEETGESEADFLPLDIFLSTGTFNRLKTAMDKYLIGHAVVENTKMSQAIINKLSMTDYKNIVEKTSYFLFKI